MLIDTHAHIDGEEYDADRDEVVARAAAAGVGRIVNMGDTMESSARGAALTGKYEAVYAGVGLHPEEAYPMTAADDDRLAGWAALPKIIAIGEIGLDYYWEKDEEKRALQRSIFIRQLDLARQLHLPWCMLAFHAPEEVLRQRVRQRQASGTDASEAGEAVLMNQLAHIDPFTVDEQAHTLHLETTQPVNWSAAWPQLHSMLGLAAEQS